MRSIINPRRNFDAFAELLLVFRTRYRLIYELTKREIGERYSGQVFGNFWAFAHPFILTLIYIFIFGFVFRARVGGTPSMPLDYTSYLLSGIIPWLIFQEAISKASSIVVNNSNIVKRVIFPIEVLPIKTVLATLTTELTFLVILLFYTLVVNHSIPWTWILVPFLLTVQILGMIGISFLFSSVGVYFRDLKDLVQIFLSIAFFILPILYLPESIPSAVRPILFINPISHMIWVYQDALYFGYLSHPWSWLIFILESGFVFVFGYRVFTKLKVMFGNVL